MGIYYGDKPAKRIWYGDRPVKAVYRGSQKVWPLNVWVGALVADSILSGNAVLARAVAGGLISVSDIVADPARLRGVTGSAIANSVLAATAMRTKAVSGGVVSQSVMQASASILTQKFADGSLDAVSAVLAAASRDRAIAGGLLAAASMSAPASRLRSVTSSTAALSAIANAPAFRFREVSGGLASISSMAGDALVEASLTYEYLGYTEGPSSYSNPYTFSSIDVGDPAADRIVVVGFSARLSYAGNNVTYTATLDGNAMNVIASPGGGHASSAMFYYNLASGTAVDLVMTSSLPNIYQARAHLWAIYGAGSTAPSHSDSDGSGASGNATSKTVTVTVPTGGVLIAHGRGFAAFSSFTPLGTNRDSWGLDNDSVSGSTDVTLTQASSTNISLVAAAWGP